MQNIYSYNKCSDVANVLCMYASSEGLSMHMRLYRLVCVLGDDALIS